MIDRVDVLVHAVQTLSVAKRLYNIYVVTTVLQHDPELGYMSIPVVEY